MHLAPLLSSALARWCLCHTSELPALPGVHQRLGPVVRVLDPLHVRGLVLATSTERSNMARPRQTSPPRMLPRCSRQKLQGLHAAELNCFRLKSKRCCLNGG